MYAIVCALLNIGLAGSGTVLAGCLEKDSWNKTQIVIGWFQFMTSPYLIGYFLAIYWSYLILMKCFKGDERFKAFSDPKTLDTLNMVAQNQDVINAAFNNKA